MNDVKLSQEQRESLDVAGQQLEEAIEVVRKLKAMGVNVTELESKLNDSIRLRKGLLELF